MTAAAPHMPQQRLPGRAELWSLTAADERVCRVAAGAAAARQPQE